MGAFDFNVVEIKNKIKEIKKPTEEDKKVYAVVDSFCCCSENYVKAYLNKYIMKYVGCRAWKIAMDYVYKENR